VKKTWDILRYGDFNYLTFTLHYCPTFTFTNKRNDCFFETDKGVKFGIELPTEIVFLDTKFESGERYFWAFSIKLLGFGFDLKRQTSY
jgi:hypothetical protein